MDRDNMVERVDIKRDLDSMVVKPADYAAHQIKPLYLRKLVP